MSLYDYKCSSCSYIFEVQQRITEEPLKHCPKCKGHIRRLIGPAGIIFKGSGFHVTDYGRPKTKDQRPKAEQSASVKTTENGSVGKPKETKSSKEASSPPKSK